MMRDLFLFVVGSNNGFFEEVLRFHSKSDFVHTCLHIERFSLIHRHSLGNKGTDIRQVLCVYYLYDITVFCFYTDRLLPVLPTPQY